MKKEFGYGFRVGGLGFRGVWGLLGFGHVFMGLLVIYRPQRSARDVNKWLRWVRCFCRARDVNKSFGFFC